MPLRIMARLRWSAVRLTLVAGLVIGLPLGEVVVIGGHDGLAAGPSLRTSVSGSPFRGSGVRARVTLTAELSEPARLTIRVVDYDGHSVRQLLDEVRGPGATAVAWDGRERHGRLVPDGPYRLRATASGASGTTTVERWVTKAPAIPYPPMPRAIVVAINPGHGGSDPGAVVARTRESDLNLDIALRLRRMLEAAGVRVVMTRTSDRDVNRPAVDRNRDGRVNHLDELVARNDIADTARADLAVNIHNNATVCRCGHGTQVFVDRRRPWSASSVRLGSAVLSSIVHRLRAFQSASWHVLDRGLGSGNYVSLRGPTRGAPRPALMPAILGESLYLDRRAERARLRDPRVRTAIAAGYFDGITRWLAKRRYGIRYTDIRVPARIAAGGTATVHLRIRNSGNVHSRSWRLVARVVRRVPVLDGTGRTGRYVGSTSLPDGLPPGDAAGVALDIRLPRSSHRWLLKLDIVRPNGTLSDQGVVQPQVPITTVRPTPPPPPGPEGSPEP